MSGYFNFEAIDNSLSKKKTEKGISSHDIGEVKFSFPFTSHTTKVFSEGINEVIGELVRLTNNLDDPEITYDGDYTYSDYPLINNVIENVKFPGDQHQEKLSKFLEEYLFKGSQELKPLHLYLFNYIEVNKDKNEKIKYARFIYDFLFYPNPEISSIFSSKDTDNLLTELIISSLKDLETRKKSKQIDGTKYSNTLPLLSELFVEDFMYLSKHKDYFINHFFNMIHFYIFQYLLQFLKKAQKFGEEQDLYYMEPFHFTFDWETGVGGYRDAVEDYKFIKNNANNLFVHVHCMSHISHNEAFYNAGHELKNYTRVINELSHLSTEERLMEKEKLYNWVKKYSELIQEDLPESFNENMEFTEMFKVLFNQLQKGMSMGVRKKYGSNIDSIGKERFLKARGKHGFILSLKQEDFLMLSAVAVKDKKIPLKEFFNQLEVRGVAFDQYSKKEAVKLLDQQNYIEKKSDSGDAQYVKPIL
ncbi:DNA phosphorothioation-dependent restriction protein DptG [Pontibacillus salipaludis]|uniref:DNA phosphorothioation-dependent restriction protein DptG n=1 Tax=Pontibacillus salipaludis TaxID=1697394 RepID=A0ABQ1PZJ5_9BACI|nr:DNA phosphorothioation-dependent restriction protein DptG [Pontibacillus salipaludis]GGD08351.1 hypothetical protein GCM10011389_14900 [Pontibacillus salipaludis]